VRAAGGDISTIEERAGVALRDAGDRAFALNALEQAERYYEQALALARDPELLLRYARVRFVHDEEGAEELAAARDGLIATGDPEAAAEASLMLANIGWKAGRRDEMLLHLDQARSLVTERPPSRAQASVLAEGARYAMLAEENEQALELGQEAIQLADELGLDDLRASALNSVGCARAHMGDVGGFTDLEESIAIATRANSPADVLRGYNNVAATRYVHADLARSRPSWAECGRLAEHFGHHGFVRFVQGGPMVVLRYHSGEWDEALARADAFLAEVESGSPHYQASASYYIRGLIRLAQGDLVGAEADELQALELSRPIKDPQRLLTVLPRAAFVCLSAGKDERAEDFLDEALEGLGGLHQLGFAAVEVPALAWVALVLGRQAAALAIIDHEPFHSLWLQAARAVALRQFQEAADVFGRIGSVPDEAFYRLRAAEQLVAEGRRTEANEQLRSALAFYRGVRATRYIREGEALLAASA
jgi:tetratricopeptide (TPR) repeat protein